MNVLTKEQEIDNLKNISDATKRKYKNVLKMWAKCFINTFDTSKPIIINKETMEKFATWLLNNKYHKNTANNATILITSMSRRLGYDVPSYIDLTQRAIMHDYEKKTDSEDNRGANTLTDEMFKELIDTIKTQWNTRELFKQRFELYCLLAYNVCGRTSEILALERKHIIFKANKTTIYIPGTKTELSRRKITLDNEKDKNIIEYLKTWIKEHKLINNDKIIFTINYQGRSKTVYTLHTNEAAAQPSITYHFQEIYKLLLKNNPKVWKDFNLSTHSLRKTQATNTYSNTDNIQNILDKGGWTKRSTSVSKYINVDLKKDDEPEIDKNKKEVIRQIDKIFYTINKETEEYLEKGGIKINVKDGLLTIIKT